MIYIYIYLFEKWFLPSLSHLYNVQFSWLALFWHDIGSNIVNKLILSIEDMQQQWSRLFKCGWTNNSTIWQYNSFSFFLLHWLFSSFLTLWFLYLSKHKLITWKIYYNTHKHIWTHPHTFRNMKPNRCDSWTTIIQRNSN